MYNNLRILKSKRSVFTEDLKMDQYSGIQEFDLDNLSETTTVTTVAVGVSSFKNFLDTSNESTSCRVNQHVMYFPKN